MSTITERELDESFRNSKCDDFYTNSIAEGDCSFVDETGNSKFINKIPMANPIVKKEAISKVGYIKPNILPPSSKKDGMIFKTLNKPPLIPYTPSKVIEKIIEKPLKTNENLVSTSIEFIKNKKKDNSSTNTISIRNYNEYLNAARKGDKQEFIKNIEL